MTEVDILKEQVKALEKLIALKNQTITQLQSAPRYQWAPYWTPYWQIPCGTSGLATSGTTQSTITSSSGISQQTAQNQPNYQQFANQGQG